MKLLDRYIFREILIPTLIALLALTFVVVSKQMGGLLELIVRRSATPAEVWALIAAVIPGMLTITIPTAVLVGILTGLGRMSSDNESVAFRAGGVPAFAILRPVMTLGFMAWALNVVLAVWIAPPTTARLGELTGSASVRLLPFELQPRVFNDELGDLVFYVQDISPNAENWRGILLADLSTPEKPSVTWAQSGHLTITAAGDAYEVTLANGTIHTASPFDPEDYSMIQFDTNRMPVPIPTNQEPIEEQSPAAIRTGELWDRFGSGTITSAEEVELNRRLALPFACLAFALIGLPLGLSTHRGGRSMGLVISALLMLVYYMVFLGGTRIADNANLSPFFGTWAANIGFALLGVLMLVRSERERRNRVLDFIMDGAEWFRNSLSAVGGKRKQVGRWAYALTHHPKWFRTLDVYVLKGFWFFFLLVLVVFVALFAIVTLFELLPDIVENDASAGVVGSYFLYLLPQILYWVVPLAVLLAVLVNLGTLTKANETLAVKAGAISLYRMSVPMVLTALLLSGGLYVIQDFLLPYSNQRQDEFRNRIKGRAQQTYRDPFRKWMAGSDNRIYYYRFFDTDQNAFAGMSVFEFDPATFALQRWTYAARAAWDGSIWSFENGWVRSIDPGGMVEYNRFELFDYSGMGDPPEYFKKEVRTASQMNYPELSLYIDDLQKSGFDVSGLTVDLYRKLSFPFVSVIMAIIAIPFAFTTGRRGAFYGIGIAIVLGIAYWAAFELFDKLGGINRLSPLIAAWFPNLIFGFSGLWLLLKVRT